MTAARLVLLRHGRTEWNVTGRFQGQAEVPLDEVPVPDEPSGGALLGAGAVLGGTVVVGSAVVGVAAVVVVAGPVVGTGA